ncbi:auxin-responsive protein SAUR36-like [Nymphaea colorata]|nr:auxin-responsive protein SAUR36-like [Nymphaea colorata]XP_049934582.1 auxin-responsive protein SAUR36-like [Nymphaea colorata]
MERVPASKAKTKKLGMLLRGLGRSSSTSPSPPGSPKWARSEEEEEGGRGRSKRRVAPEGCFSVYVGPERKRFVVKTEHANHPLFRMLLEEAESEYGFCSEGPIALPCDVDLFLRVLWEMDADEAVPRGRGCAFPTRKGGGIGGYQLLSPSRFRVG